MEMLKAESVKKLKDNISQLGEDPDIMFVLSGGVVSKGGRLVSTGYDDPQQQYGFLDGKERIVATSLLSQAYPQSEIVTLSQGPLINKPNDSEVINYAKVQKDELIALGVRPDRIHTDQRSVNTANEMLIAVDYSETKNAKNIIIIAGGSQVNRAVAMWDNLESILNKGDIPSRIRKFKETACVTIIDSSSVLSSVFPKFNSEFIEKIKQRPEYALRVQSDSKGIKDIKDKKYVSKVVLDI